MAAFIISLTAFLASLLTLFSGFGLGTILMPIAAIFFPVTVAVALTALVHLINNLFKLILLWRHINWPVVLRFGLPAAIAAFPGALLLTRLSTLPGLHVYAVAGLKAEITPVKLAIGLLLIFFATLEWLPILKKVNLPAQTLPFGGILSGFFGGLSGHQGAFRSAFLMRTGLNKDQFVSSNAAIAALVDLARLAIYGLNFRLVMAQVDTHILTAATVAALAGALTGTLFLQKITIIFIQRLVVATLYILGLLIASGLI